jgi:hypothetical protein
MKVLVACEFSGIVRDAFIAKGHDAVSCDLLPTERPGPHIQGDVLGVLEDGWDLMIAHPPCTYLCRNGARWLTTEKKEAFMDATLFWGELAAATIDKICMENPIPHKLATYCMGDYTQIIHPWQFGHDYAKKTCLWLKGLPVLVPTKIVEVTYITTKNGRRYTAGWYKTPRNSIARSRTFQGIADAMAEQWGALEKQI